MNYPAWDVPLIGAGWVVGAIAIFHVMISHFAVGGGFYLPLAERKGLRENRADWLEVLRGHARFFLILTAAFGTISGVGIWFAIGLANPEATSALIHNFVFAWAIEWTLFLVEVTSIAVYYYTWGRIPARDHLRVGWLYAATAWLSLVVINGILCFMLTPGDPWMSVAGSGREASRFWQALFNPTYLPSLALRTLICISLAGVFALVTASRIDKREKPELKESVVRWSARWLIPAYVLLPICFVWYLAMAPEAQRELLWRGVSTAAPGMFTQLTRAALVTVATSATIAVIVGLQVWRNARDFSMGHAAIVVLLALAATASTEYARELLRKPFVIGRYMYATGVRASDVARINEQGYLASTIWLRDSERRTWPPTATRAADPNSHAAAGELMLRGQCRSCHTIEGYRSLQGLLAGRDREGIGNILKILHDYAPDSPYRGYMPPLVGTDAEISALGDYLDALVNPAPSPSPSVSE